MQLRTSLLGLTLAAAILPGHARAQVTTENFLLRNTGDLVALCSATSSDPMAVQAVNFCNGFAVGVVRVLQKVDAAEAPHRALFCLPKKRPSRSESVAEFVRWANADPTHEAMPAEDGLASFLAAIFPCPPGQ
ncbi:MAG: Rap1a/Tai family immunity protein [Acetobacteraceae bacterium]